MRLGANDRADDRRALVHAVGPIEDVISLVVINPVAGSALVAHALEPKGRRVSVGDRPLEGELLIWTEIEPAAEDSVVHTLNCQVPLAEQRVRIGIVDEAPVSPCAD